MINKFRISHYMILLIFFIAMAPLMFSTYWSLTTTGELYISLEISGSFFSTLVGLSSFLFFYSNGNIFFLILGIGFTMSGTEDMMHGLIGIENLLSGSLDHIDYHKTGTFLGDDFILSLIILSALIIKDRSIGRERRKKVLIPVVPVSLITGVILTLAAVYSPVSSFKTGNGLISEPVHLITSLIFTTSFIQGVRICQKKQPVFHHFLLLSILQNAGAYFYMSFTKIPHDVFFDFGLFINTISYIFPIIGFLATILDQHRELIQKEEEIRENRNYLTAVLTASPDSIYVIGPDYSINTSLARPGTEREESILPLIPEKYRKEYKKIFHKCRYSGKIERLEMTEGTGPGKRFILIRLFSIENRGDESNIVHIATDVTELNRQKQALIASEKRYDHAMSIANDGVWDWDMVDQRFQFDNRCYRMAGYSPGSFPPLREEWEKRMHPDDLERVKRSMNDYLNGLTPVYDVEFRFMTASGKYMWLKAKAKIINSDKNNRPLRMIGIHSDVTEMKKATEVLRSTIEETRQMNELMTGREFRILEIKKEVNQLLEELGRDQKYKVTN